MPLGKMSKEDEREIGRWLKPDMKNMRWGPKKVSLSPKQPKGNRSLNAATETFAVLPISEIEVGEQLLAPDLAAIAELRASISVGGNIAPPIIVPKRADGTYELLDGQTRLAALKETVLKVGRRTLIPARSLDAFIQAVERQNRGHSGRDSLGDVSHD